MIVDTSVLVALLKEEPEARRFIQALASTEVARLSAGNWVEVGAITSGDNQEIIERLNSVMTFFSIAIEPVTVQQAQIAQAAYRTFGKGHHKARLNFGDCFAYALAIATGEPLLFKGDDFVHTDVKRAI